MKTVMIMLMGAAVCVLSVPLHSIVLGTIGIVVTVSGFIWQIVIDRRRNKFGNQKIKETNDALKNGVVQTLQLMLNRVAAHPKKAAEHGQVIALLVEAASYLGNPPNPGQRIVGPKYVIDWKNKGLAKLAQAKMVLRKTIDLAEMADIRQRFESQYFNGSMNSLGIGTDADGSYCLCVDCKTEGALASITSEFEIVNVTRRVTKAPQPLGELSTIKKQIFSSPTL